MLLATGCEQHRICPCISLVSRSMCQCYVPVWLTWGNSHRNNFIVGQVTPDMLAAMPYGTYILFGILTYLGAAFIWFFVPETKRLTLEEMVRNFSTPTMSLSPPLLRQSGVL